MHEDDLVFVLKGKLKVVSRIFGTLLNLLSERFEDIQIHEEGIRMLIPNNFVILLIGAKGGKIKDLI